MAGASLVNSTEVSANKNKNDKNSVCCDVFIN